MGSDQRGDALSAQVVEDFQDRLLAGHVEAGQRLVQHQQLGLLGQGTRQEDPLLLTAGQFADLAFGEVGHADLRQRRLDHGPIAPARPAQQPDLADAPHHHHIADRDREAPVDAVALGHIADADVPVRTAAVDVDRRPGPAW